MMSNSNEFLHPDMSEAGVGDAAGLTMKEKPPLNLVLIGSRGAEKTAAAEVILDQTDLPPASSPSECVKHEEEVCGRQLSVLEMPPLYDRPPEEVMEESFRCVSLCGSEGVHAFILVLPVAPLTDEDKGELQTIQDTFSPRVKDFTMILFTVDSDPAAPAVVNFIRDKEIQELCQSCGGRYVVLNTKDKKQIPQLLETVDKMCSESSRGFTKETLTKGNMERVLQLQAELQDVKHKVDTDGELRGRLEEREEEMKKREEEMKKREEELKNHHREEVKTLRAQVEQERKQRVQQLKEKAECLEEEREKRKKEAEEEEKRRRKQEAQRQEWKQKLEAAERKAQSERAEREKAENKLEQNNREMKRNRDVWEKEKNQMWERVIQDLKQDLEEERSSHRKLQEEYHKKRRKWVYPWIFLSPLLLCVYLLFQFFTT